jgi:FMN reductase
MPSCTVLGLSASPSSTSKTALIVDRVLDHVRRVGLDTRHIRLRELDPAALLTGNLDNPGIAALAKAVEDAHGVVIATPIFKASFSGLLKASLDFLPQFALSGKVVLPLATGGSVAHVLALDYALRPVLQSMGARHIVQAHFICETDLTLAPAGLEIKTGAEGPLMAAIRNFSHSITDEDEVKWLGHPRPPVKAPGFVV